MPVVTPPLAIGPDCFLRNGARHRIFSGALHYFRVPPAAWEDRLLKYRACGLNTVETYVAWNVHEPQPGRFDFTAQLDLARFIRLAGSLGLDVILRPGPYICAEWDLGGLPAWLLADSTMKLRTTHPGYLDAVARYFDRVIDEVRPLLAHNGGPIVAVQIENEYGSYGNSRAYLEWIERALLSRGVNELLFTSDGPEDAMLQGGTLPHVFKTVNFGSRAREAFAKLRDYQPAGPLMCMEFWCGWFDHWGKAHHTRTAEDAAATLDEILSAGGSVNFYMFHGGTNFGFMAGANQDERYCPTVTSYDYDAPLDERGEPTAKYHAFRQLLAKHGAKTEAVPPTDPARAYGSVALTETAPLFAHAATLPAIRAHDPLCQESLGQNHGFTLYRTRVSGPRPAARLHIEDVRDRAHVYQDGVFVGVLDRDQPHAGIPLTIPAQGSRLDILVENLGRVNYGAIHDRKGITRGVRLQWQWLTGWEMCPLDLSPLPDTLSWSPASDSGSDTPVFHRGTLQINASAPSDTWLHVSGGHGIAWINGFCLGRYWNIGPQLSLYVPASVLRSGHNELVLLETEPRQIPTATFEEKTRIKNSS